MNLYQYLKYGCPIPFPDLNYETSDGNYQDIISENVKKIENPKDGIFQLSGGFDSSIIVSYFKNIGINTLCMKHENNEDVKYSKIVSDHFKTNHILLDEKELLSSTDFKKLIIDINSIHSYPRSFKNDAGLYIFVKWAKDNFDFIVGGEGIEFQMLGYSNIYFNLLHLAIANNQYSVQRAFNYLKNRKCNSPLHEKLSTEKVLKYKEEKVNFFDIIDWWSSNFTDNEIEKLGVKIEKMPVIEDINDIIYFLFSWYGKQYVIDRRKDLCKKFDIEWYTPYLEDNFVNYTLGIPVELKNCLGYYKFIFYESMYKRLPQEIVTRPKVGLMTNFEFYLENYQGILSLIDEFLRSKNRIYDFIDHDECKNHVNNFVKKFDHNNFVKLWSLLNLSIWMETHGI